MGTRQTQWRLLVQEQNGAQFIHSFDFLTRNTAIGFYNRVNSRWRGLGYKVVCLLKVTGMAKKRTHWRLLRQDERGKQFFGAVYYTSRREARARIKRERTDNGLFLDSRVVALVKVTCKR